MAKRVLVLGLGLIGGSLSLNVKKEHPGCTLIGWDADDKVNKLALSLKIVDETAVDYKKEAVNADLIILAVPVQSAVEMLGELSELQLKKDCIITDVGSTKTTIMDKARVFSEKGAAFIGGHPMAGSHKTGVTASNERLFENAFYILTPPEGTPASKIIQLQNWLRGTRSKFIELHPEEHDRFAGMISHLPHIIASSLVLKAGEMGKENPIVSRLAAGGFRDLTRIASASPAMWRDILLHNRQVLLEMLQEWDGALQEVKNMLEEEDKIGIYNFFAEAKALRDQLPARKKGALMPFNDLYVDIPDHPGVISDVTGILAKKEISLTNIRIIEAREDIMGVLQLSFRSREDLVTAKQILHDHMYETHELL
ncbi:prephenate dehydrogenase [Evansella clarkii]|uniref:prephenate dehydrogenase n=1 Tax=Evansella clarkii TaxID=79879 RepID=UPI000998386E|nr:prephenate dehydrogenase [Evansella clarkii]